MPLVDFRPRGTHAARAVDAPTSLPHRVRHRRTQRIAPPPRPVIQRRDQRGERQRRGEGGRSRRADEVPEHQLLQRRPRRRRVPQVQTTHAAANAVNVNVVVVVVVSLDQVHRRVRLRSRGRGATARMRIRVPRQLVRRQLQDEGYHTHVTLASSPVAIRAEAPVRARREPTQQHRNIRESQTKPRGRGLGFPDGGCHVFPPRPRGSRETRLADPPGEHRQQVVA